LLHVPAAIYCCSLPLLLLLLLLLLAQALHSLVVHAALLST
jgi:hypothetical protein